MDKKTFEHLKAELSTYQGERDVETWNRLREVYKATYSQEVISELDGSGYINQWLKG
jgi:hypothetical protein